MASRLVPIAERRPAGTCAVEPVPLGVDVSLGAVDVSVVGGGGTSVGVVDELGAKLDEMIVERISDTVDSEPVEAPDEEAPPRLAPEPPPREPSPPPPEALEN